MFIHLDLDAFFINAARKVDKSLKSVPAAVISGNNVDIFGDFLPAGIVLSASYEARKLGIKCTMSANKAQKICPNIKLVSTDFSLYKKLSNALFKILYDYTDEIEKYSIDEFFIDLTGTKHDKNALALAKNLQEKIKNELDLPCSIGIAAHKWWAKLATELAKPEGIKEIKSFDDIANVQINAFAGVGKANSEFFKKHGITKLADAAKSKDVFSALGKHGISLYEHICGLGGDKLRKNEPRKSLAIARTFAGISDRFEIKRRIKILCNHLFYELYKHELSPKKLELKLSYFGGNLLTHGFEIECELSQASLINAMISCFVSIDSSPDAKINYISIGASQFYKSAGLFWQAKSNKQKALDDAINKLRDKYNEKII